jgi:MraZ protein
VDGDLRPCEQRGSGPSVSEIILFTGNAFSVADGKGRFVLPLEMRRQVKLSSGGETRLYLSVHGDNPCATGFGESHRRFLFTEVEELAREARAAGRDYNADLELERRLGTIEEVNFDDGGRFAMHPDIKDEYSITDAVFFYGVGRYIQIWKPETLVDSKDRPELIRNKVRRCLDQRAAGVVK